MSNYQVLDALPTFEQAKWTEDGKRVPSVSGMPAWSNAVQPPATGNIVNVRMNGIGLSEVVGYFVEDGYLGLLVKPFDPPEWYVAQNGYDATGHAFGAEIEIGDFAAPVLSGPSQKQLAALQRYATANGRNWKSALNNAWFSGKDEQEPDSALLRQVRNQFGPKWLTSTKNPIKPKADDSRKKAIFARLGVLSEERRALRGQTTPEATKADADNWEETKQLREELEAMNRKASR